MPHSLAPKSSPESRYETKLLPLPDAEGIAKTKKLYLDRFGMKLSDEQAADVLGRVMRYISLLSELCSDTASTPENPTKSETTP